MKFALRTREFIFNNIGCMLVCYTRFRYCSNLNVVSRQVFNEVSNCFESLDAALIVAIRIVLIDVFSVILIPRYISSYRSSEPLSGAGSRVVALCIWGDRNWSGESGVSCMSFWSVSLLVML